MGSDGTLGSLASSGSEANSPEFKAQALASGSLARALNLLTDLVRHPTFEPRQCIGTAPFVIDAMTACGFDIEEHYPKNRDGHPLPVIIGWLGPRTRQPDILLCAHMDTSPPGTGWSRDPYGAERSGGVLFGRGAVVSKSDIACFIFAAEAAHQAAGGAYARTIAVAVTSDEGAGGDYGAAYLLKDLNIQPKIAIFPGMTDVVADAHKGCVQVKVRIAGTACHQSILKPNEDAMRRASALCKDIYLLADRLAPHQSSAGALLPTLNVTRICGGTEFGMAPHEVDVWIDRRVSPEEQLQAARDELLSLINANVESSNARVTCEVVRMAEPMRATGKQRHFLDLLREEAKLAFGKELTVAGSPLYTDARWFSSAGIPTIMYGAGEADIQVSGANGINERVPEECVEQAMVILARAMVRVVTERLNA